MKLYVTIHVTTTRSNSSLCLYLLEIYGGRDRTRTCDLLRVKHAKALVSIFYFLLCPLVSNNLGHLLSLS